MTTVGRMLIQTHDGSGMRVRKKVVVNVRTGPASVGGGVVSRFEG